PLICPHGHVDPAILADDVPFADPARLIGVPDHYVTRMLLSQGIPPARLGVPFSAGGAARDPDDAPEADGREIWRRFATHWHLFRGTPSRQWLGVGVHDQYGVPRVVPGGAR